jgi:hypothetical protein
LSIKPIGDSRINHIEERRNDSIQVRSDLDFIVKFFIVQFYAFEHNSKSNRWIELKLDLMISEVLFYVGVKFKVIQSLERTCDRSEQAV